MEPAVRRAATTFVLGLVGVPLALATCPIIGFYVLGNGPVPGAFALSTIPLLLIAPAALAWGRGRGLLAGLTAALLGFDVLFAATRLCTAAPDGPIALWSDGQPAAAIPWYAALVREDETAYAGIALTRSMGALSVHEAAAISAPIRAKYEGLPQPRGANAVLLWSTPEHVTSLVWIPPGDGEVPAIVFLHGFGGLLTTYVSALLESPDLARYAIIAPAYGTLGAWWEDDGHQIVARTLDDLPTRVHRDRVYLVGLSNGAIGATSIASDPELAPRFRAAVTLVGLGDFDGGIPRIPMGAIVGVQDERFTIDDVEREAQRIHDGGGDIEVFRYDFDHIGPFSHTAQVDATLAAYLARH